MGSAVNILRSSFQSLDNGRPDYSRNITTKLGNIVVEITKTVTGITGAVDGFS